VLLFRQYSWKPIVATALAGLYAMIGPVRSAGAAGCHADDRPRFGLTTLPVAIDGATTDRHVSLKHHWSPRPCSGDPSADYAAAPSPALSAEPLTHKTTRTITVFSKPIRDRRGRSVSVEDRSRPPRHRQVRTI
jgi:hypothetical protein